MWDKVFKNGPSRICGKQPIKKFTRSSFEYFVPYYSKFEVNLKKLYGPFLCPYASRLQPLRGGILLFIIQFPEISGAHFIDLGKMKAESTLEPPSGFEHGTPGLVIQHLDH